MAALVGMAAEPSISWKARKAFHPAWTGTFAGPGSRTLGRFQQCLDGKRNASGFCVGHRDACCGASQHHGPHEVTVTPVAGEDGATDTISRLAQARGPGIVYTKRLRPPQTLSIRHFQREFEVIS